MKTASKQSKETQVTQVKPATALPQFTRSYLKEVLINCREDVRDPGLGELLRAAEQYDALLEVNGELVAALRHVATGGENWKDCANSARALLRKLGEAS